MKTVDDITKAVQELTRDELATFRKWFEEFDQDLWDKQIAADAAAGRLDDLAKEALEEYRSGRTKPL